MLLANLRGVYFFRSIAVKIFSDSVQAVMEERFKQSFLVKTRMTDFQECLYRSSQAEMDNHRPYCRDLYQECCDSCEWKCVCV